MKKTLIFLTLLFPLLAASVEGVGYGLTKDAAIEQIGRAHV